jgi:hypothetical protein
MLVSDADYRASGERQGHRARSWAVIWRTLESKLRRVGWRERMITLELQQQQMKNRATH